MSSVPVAQPGKTAREIARFILESGYTQAGLRKLGLTRVPWRGSQARALLEHSVPDRPVLRALLQLFFFGETLPIDGSGSGLPREAVEQMAASGMLRRQENSLVPECLLTHFGDLLLACDSVRRVETGETADLVLGVNSPAGVLAHSLIHRPDAEVLDLGTGCGTLALAASGFAREVTATDLNPRALAFTQFNAALNGVSNVGVRCGDRFEPVAGRHFDLIACNPPFFLTPNPRLMFTDNPSELDSFVEGLARTAPGHLKESGFFQMLCEWVEFHDQPGKTRLAGWFDGSGCDVLVLKAYEIAPVDYTLKRAAEAAALHGDEGENSLRQRAEYFARRSIVKIIGGLITMRRRQGHNWLVFEEMDEAPSESIGEALRTRFDNQDVLELAAGAGLLVARPRVAGGVRLVEESLRENRSWKKNRIYLERRGGLERRLGFDSGVAELIARCDGTLTVNTLLGELAKKRKLPRADVVDDGLRLVRRLAELTLIEFAGG